MEHIRGQTFNTQTIAQSARDFECLQAAFDSRSSVNSHRMNTNLYSAVLNDLLPWLFTTFALRAKRKIPESLSEIYDLQSWMYI